MTRLELQLSEAERRQELGGRMSRLLAPARVWRPTRATLAGLAAAAVLAIAVVAGIAALGRVGEHRVARPGPRVVARLHTGTIFGMTAGFGAVWLNANDHNQVFRVDPGTHRIVARIPIGRLPTGIATAGGSVWVATHTGTACCVVSRIDPATNRVQARIRLTGDAAAAVGRDALPRLRASGDVLWVMGGDGGVRIDARRGAITKVVPWGLAPGVGASEGGAVAGDDLWVHADDGRLLLLDARTGARRAAFASPAGRANLAALPGHAVVLAHGDTVTRIDAATGRARWSAQLAKGAPVSTQDIPISIALAGGSLWALSENQQQVTERLSEIDLASGRVLASVPVGDVGADGLTVVGPELWYATDLQTVAFAP